MVKITEEQKQKRYMPTNDVIFKCLLGNAGNERITKSFLESVVGEQIEEISTDFKLELLKEKPEDKQMIADVVARDNKLQKYIIEMQKEAYKYLPNRFIGYMSKTYVADIKVKAKYTNLKRTVLVVLMEENFPNLQDIEEYHTVWHYREQNHKEKVLTKCTEIHILELNKYKKQKKKGGKIDPWLEFFINPYGEEVKEMARTREELEEAVRQYRILCADEEVQRIADAEDWARYDYNSILEEKTEDAIEKGLAQGMEKGLAQGMEKGLAQGLAQGLEQGLEQGKAETKAKIIDIAKNMIRQKINISIISSVTGLNIDEIEKLKDE